MTNRNTVLRLVEKLFLSFADVDWSRTLCYSKGNYGQLFINRSGREPLGSVPAADAEQVVGRLREDLAQLVDPETGRPIVEAVFRRDDLYEGECVDAAPDLCFLLSPGYKALGTVAFTSNAPIEPAFGNSGDHRMDGVLAMHGPGIRSGARVEGASILDLAPTILHLLGLPVDGDMDGRVLHDCFEEAFIREHPVTYTDGSEAAHASPPPDRLSDEESDEIRERLRRLGYIA